MDCLNGTFPAVYNILVLVLQERIQVSGKGVHMNKGVGFHFADFISFCLNIP